jgi:catechol 2,3-dioxygenase-like lactoylglutathione lyase family enzyme
MTLNHMHVPVRDLKAVVEWFETVLQVKSVFRNDRMAVFGFGSLTLICDVDSDDSPITLGFQSDDCDGEFRGVVERGAIAIALPRDRAGGIRAASFKGPGALTFQIEGPSAPS